MRYQDILSFQPISSSCSSGQKLNLASLAQSDRTAIKIFLFLPPPPNSLNGILVHHRATLNIKVGVLIFIHKTTEKQQNKIVETQSSNRVNSERLDSRVSSFKFREARFPREIILICFLKERCCIQSRSRSEIRTNDRLKCQLRQAFNKRKSIFSVSKMQLQ